jgi:hypothetical protein
MPHHSSHWGVGEDGTGGCSDCCGLCGNDISPQNLALTPSTGAQSGSSGLEPNYDTQPQFQPAPAPGNPPQLYAPSQPGPVPFYNNRQPQFGSIAPTPPIPYSQTPLYNTQPYSTQPYNTQPQPPPPPSGVTSSACPRIMITRPPQVVTRVVIIAGRQVVVRVPVSPLTGCPSQ